MPSGEASAGDEAVAEPAENRRAHQIGIGERESGGDPRAHRIAHHIGARDAEMGEQAPGILRHQRQRISGGIIELVALPVAAVVERDDAPPVAGERLDPLRIDPIDGMVRGKAMDQKDRLAAIGRRRRNVDIGDAHAIRREELHADPELDR